MYPSERTPLASAQPGPPYVFMSNPNRVYRNQIRQFQCCVCATVLSIFLSALIVTILYSVDGDVEDTTPSVSTPAPSNSTLNTLMQLSYPVKDEVPPGWSGPFPDSNQFLTAVEQSKEKLAKKADIEKKMPPVVKDSPTFRYRQTLKTSEKAKKLADYGHVVEEMTKQLKSTFGQGNGRGPKIDSSILANPACVEKNLEDCNVSRYRSFDGSCNNLKSDWGSALKPFRRALPPQYADGISSPRVASDDTPLPSAREVSVTIHPPELRDEPKFSVMMAVWGQFLDHDLTATALSQGENGEPISCCSASETNSTIHPECMPVFISKEDPIFKDNMNCLDFVRSAPAPMCTLGPREQLNQASSYLDGSVIYGNDEDLANQLRSFKNGELLVSKATDGKGLLPASTDPNDGCNEEEENEKGRYCFMTGDGRANENLHLTTMHLLLVRQHNLIAKQLKDLNPHWSDEDVYQETRHIVTAQMQHITYNEFLPILLGPQLMEKLDLNPQASGYWNKYNDSIDPTVANNFATSSFRFAHTLIPGLMKLADENANTCEYVHLHKMLFNPYKLYSPGYADQAIKGALATSLERADSYFTPELTEYLFKKDSEEDKKKPTFGLDLVSLNVQRGRDHGLPSYPNWREHCGFERPKSFEDLQGHLDDSSLDKISSLYKSVDDVDLYTGSLAEIPIEDGLLGPTLTCLLADQFTRLKEGDRYWYETPSEPQRFSPEQLDELRKTSLARLICDASDNITKSQRFVMQSVSPTNEVVPCEEIQRPNFSAWKENYRQRVNISLVGGEVSTFDETLVWEGSLPVAVPLPGLISSQIKETDELSNVKFNHGIQWFTNSLKVDGNYIHSNGSFSIPYNKNGKNTEWVNGKFNLQFKTDDDVNLIRFQDQIISSPVYFKADKEMEMPLLTQTPDSYKVPSNLPIQHSPAVKGYDKLKAPIFLSGSFNNDFSQFYWKGEGFILFTSEKSLDNDDDSDLSVDKQNDSSKDSSDEDREFYKDWEIVPVSDSKKMQDSINKETSDASTDTDSDNSWDKDWENLGDEKQTPEVVYDSDKDWDTISGFIRDGSQKVNSDIRESSASKVKLPPGDEFPHPLKFQLTSSTNETDDSFDKMRSIPGHHMDIDEKDSEWELVPGTVSDYRRKNSTDPMDRGPAEKKKKKKSTVSSSNDFIADNSVHRRDQFVKFQLKQVPNTKKSTEKQSDSTKKNRILIKLDPSVDLFPSEWKYNSESGNRIIPVDFFYKVNATQRISKPIIIWNAKINPKDSLMEGNVSIPAFVLDASHSRRVIWQNSSFSLNFQASAENILHFFVSDSIPHNSRIVLKDFKCSNVENISNDFETLNWELNTFQKIALVEAGQTLPSSSIMLIGEFSPNKTAFEWNGSLMIDFFGVGKETNYEAALKGITPNWFDMPLKVVSVSINATDKNGKVAPRGWTSFTPNTFPFSTLVENHVIDANSAVLWSGHVEGDKLKGTFSLPLVNHSAKAPNLFKGQFELQLAADLPKVTWNNPKHLYTDGGRNSNFISVPYLDIWPPPPSWYPCAFPVPFPLNISSSPYDNPVKTVSFVQNLVESLSSSKKNPAHEKSVESSVPLSQSFNEISDQKQSDNLVKPTPASSHLLKITVPWPPVYPKWPSDQPPPPWEQEPYPLRDYAKEKQAKSNGDKKVDAKKSKVKPGTNDGSPWSSNPVQSAKSNPAVKEPIDKLTQIYMKRLASVIKPNVQYSTKIVVESNENVGYETKKLNLSHDVKVLLDNSVPSKVIVNGMWKQNNNYYWPGNAVFLLAPSPSKTSVKMVKKPAPFRIFGDPISILPYFKGPYAATVVDGSVSSGIQLTGSSTIWSGKMPFNIPLPVSWASPNVTEDGNPSVKGIHWTPSLVSYNRVEGNYVLDSSEPSEQYHGSFRFELRPLWSDTTINKLLIPGRKYYSKIDFVPIPEWQKPHPNWLKSEPFDDSSSEKPAPIQIRGNYNEDGSSFEWTGNAIIKIT